MTDVWRSGDLPAVASRSTAGRHTLVDMHLTGISRYRGDRKTEREGEQDQTGPQPL